MKKQYKTIQKYYIFCNKKAPQRGLLLLTFASISFVIFDLSIFVAKHAVGTIFI